MEGSDGAGTSILPSGLLLDSVLLEMGESASCFLLGGKYPLRREAKLRLSRGGFTFGSKENKQLNPPSQQSPSAMNGLTGRHTHGGGG